MELGTRLPSLYGGSHAGISAQSSFLTKSRRSTASLLSYGSGNSSSRSSQKGKIVFKPVSYFLERKQSNGLEVLHHLNRVYRNSKTTNLELIEQKAKITANTARERAHIESLRQENEEREQSIKDTLRSLRNSKKGHRVDGQPPSIEQLRILSNAILKEGLRFKELSEQPSRIEREIYGVTPDEAFPVIADLQQQSPKDGATVPQVVEFQRTKLSNLVYKYEDMKTRLATTMNNREMLSRMIFDRKTSLEALKVKKATLIDEGKRLEETFELNIQNLATQMGHMAWKYEMAKACSKITSLPKEHQVQIRVR